MDKLSKWNIFGKHKIPFPHCENIRLIMNKFKRVKTSVVEIEFTGSLIPFVWISNFPLILSCIGSELQDCWTISLMVMSYMNLNYQERGRIEVDIEGRY